MARLICDDCEHEQDGEPVAGDDWPDGVLRPIWPDCPVCREEGAEVPMRCIQDDGPPTGSD
jgi:hypothetical protein